jgi:hypothetical protein
VYMPCLFNYQNNRTVVPKNADLIFKDCFPTQVKESLTKAPAPRARKAPRGPRGPTNQENEGRTVGEAATPIGQGNVGHRLLMKMVFTDSKPSP